MILFGIGHWYYADRRPPRRLDRLVVEGIDAHREARRLPVPERKTLARLREVVCLSQARQAREPAPRVVVLAALGVRCRGLRLNEPCSVLHRYSSRPVLRPLVHRGGLRADILEDGVIRCRVKKGSSRSAPIFEAEET